ncbi:ATP-dependent RNA helicase DHX8 [Polychaeton citri CBS 116435]|uniref:ATP-dependent RNA helicase DHX8 n=1 Tax=Polychaeton citri CBS 116435 TaxID=1314669 RepID=A0A9P4QC91_9PEZI|nr:ATP-dependent RNA helicase DHX8 [Polychaeton citri CBS 116435]
MGQKQREIRALYDDECITLYQAYNKEIASAAISNQRLSSSPLFKPGRTTWFKPSWCWVLYRSGYSYKDANQERVLAIRVKHEHFLELLRRATLAHSEHERGKAVVIQWDPERSPSLGRLNYRSIQIGVPGALMTTWLDERIESIEDVTETARGLKAKLDESPDVTSENLIALGLLPQERVFEVDNGIAKALEMD